MSTYLLIQQISETIHMAGYEIGTLKEPILKGQTQKRDIIQR